MNTNTTNRTYADLIAEAGSNVPKEKVRFDQQSELALLPKKFAGNIRASIEWLEGIEREFFECTERTEAFPNMSRNELAVALDRVLHTMGVPRTVSWPGHGTPTSRRISLGFDWASGDERFANVPDGFVSLPGFAPIPQYKAEACVRVIGDSTGAHLVANVLRLDEAALEGVFSLVRKQANRDTIYAGQVVDVYGNFINMTKFKPQNVALTEEAQLAVDIYVRQQLINSEQLDDANQSPKTSILFEGPPGGGKTMTVSLSEYLVAAKGGCVVHVDPDHGLEGLDQAMAMSQRLLEAGHTVLIATEDIEKLMPSERSRGKVLELLDGAGTKTARRIVIGTTNFLERLDRAMLRPGRFDAIVHCGLPDLKAFTHLVKVLLPAEYIGDVDWERAFPPFEGYSYASIANAVSRVIRIAIARGDEQIKVSTDDLIAAAEMQRRHHDILNEEVEKDEPTLDNVFRQMRDEGVNEVVTTVIDECHDYTDYDAIASIVQEQTDGVVEHRIHGASLYDEERDRTVGKIHTN